MAIVKRLCFLLIFLCCFMGEFHSVQAFLGSKAAKKVQQAQEKLAKIKQKKLDKANEKKKLKEEREKAKQEGQEGSGPFTGRRGSIFGRNKKLSKKHKTNQEEVLDIEQIELEEEIRELEELGPDQTKSTQRLEQDMKEFSEMDGFTAENMLKFTIDKQGEETFYINVENTNKQLRGYFMTTNKDPTIDPVINFFVQDPNGRTIVAKVKRSMSQFDFMSQEVGEYKIVFSNLKYDATKDVQIALYNQEEKELEDKSNQKELDNMLGSLDEFRKIMEVETKDQLDELTKNMSTIQRGVDNIHVKVKTTLNYKKKHNIKLDYTFTNSLRQVIGETLVCAFVAFVSVRHIKNHLTKGRVLAI